MGMDVCPPEMTPIGNDKTETYIRALRNKVVLHQLLSLVSSDNVSTSAVLFLGNPCILFLHSSLEAVSLD